MDARGQKFLQVNKADVFLTVSDCFTNANLVVFLFFLDHTLQRSLIFLSQPIECFRNNSGWQQRGVEDIIKENLVSVIIHFSFLCL